MGRHRITRGTARYKRGARLAVEETTEVANRFGIRGFYHYVGTAHNARQFSALVTKADVVARAKGRPAGIAACGVLRPQGREGLADRIRPFAALIVSPGAGLPAKFETFRKLRGDRGAFVHVYRPDRYSAGFYAAACGADGCYVTRVLMPSSPYGGFDMDGSGLVAPCRDGSFCGTLGALRLRQGTDDFLLVRRARALMQKAAAAKLSALELDNALSAIISAAEAHRSVGYDQSLLRTTAVSPKRLEEWRAAVILAAGSVAKRLKGG
jgi:hypothetical protein